MEKFRQFKRDNGSVQLASGPVKPQLKFGVGHHASNSVNICIPSYNVNLSRARNTAANENGTFNGEVVDLFSADDEGDEIT